AQTTESTDLRQWVACLVCPLTEHLAAMGNPTWYARFAAQAMADPTYQETVVKDALASPSLVQVIKGINRCIPALRDSVRIARSTMVRNLLMHTAAEWERALAEGAPMPGSGWPHATTDLIDAIVGLWLAPVTTASDNALRKAVAR
ncbi:MAG: TetR family transcriptional regulator, partial [Mycobacterium sp.]